MTKIGYSVIAVTNGEYYPSLSTWVARWFCEMNKYDSRRNKCAMLQKTKPIEAGARDYTILAGADNRSTAT